MPSKTTVPAEQQEERYRALLEEVEARLEEAAKGRYGRYRGREKIRAMLRAEAPSGVKRSNVNLHTAQTELSSLIYQRHALKHGYFRISEMTKKELAISFLGPDAENIQMETFQARIILKEQWRWGHSALLEDFRKKLHAREDRLQRIKTNYCRKQAVEVIQNFETKWRQKESESVRRFENDLMAGRASRDDDQRRRVLV